MMTINVFSTSNNVLRVIQTNATNWDGLYTELSNGSYTSEDGVTSYDLSNTSCKVKENKMAFENSASGRTAALPTGLGKDGVDFTLFIVPQKIKSGNFITNADVFKKLEEVDAKINALGEMFAQFMNSVDCVETSSNDSNVGDSHPRLVVAEKTEAEIKREKLEAELAAEAASFLY